MVKIFQPTEEDMKRFMDYCHTCHCENEHDKYDDGLEIVQGLQFLNYQSLPYAFTLRRTSKKIPVTEQLYRDRFADLYDKHGINVVDYVFELEAGLHSHGILELPVKFNMKKLRVRGWNMLVKPLENEYGWITYMNKKQGKALP